MLDRIVPIKKHMVAFMSKCMELLYILRNGDEETMYKAFPCDFRFHFKKGIVYNPDIHEQAGECDGDYSLIHFCVWPKLMAKKKKPKGAKWEKFGESGTPVFYNDDEEDFNPDGYETVEDMDGEGGEESLNEQVDSDGDGGAE